MSSSPSFSLKRTSERSSSAVGSASPSSRSQHRFSTSGPLLYRDVVIDEEGQISKLFCEQHSPSSTTVSPYLSLSQIKTFTILHENNALLFLSKFRFPNGLPLEVDVLALRPTHVNRSSNEYFFMLRTKHVNRMKVCLAFNPIPFVAQYPTTQPFPDVEEGENYGELTYRWQGFAVRPHLPLPWTRLEKVLYDGCYFVSGPMDDDALRFAPLSFESSSSSRLRITYDLSSLEDVLLFVTEALVDFDEGAVDEDEVYFLDSGVAVLELAHELTFFVAAGHSI
ncbi:hypothetical protein BDY24DRAFT_443628 [Mrakia frigida]|uniref:uncharacterized protein n=1 Tax=Mrakia frigida TaxID=29902 RepID=UPI003FCBFD27